MHYRAIAINVCRGMLEDLDLAEEVVQVVIVTITRKLKEGGLSFSSREHLRNYFIKSVKNRATDALKDREKWLKESENILSGLEEEVKDPLDALIAREEEDRNNRMMDGVVEGVRKLRRTEREVILLRYMRGMKYREISELTGVPLTTLKSREDSALRKLRKIIVRSEMRS